MNEIDQLQQDWDDLADIDPLWAICSDPSKQFNRWRLDEFFATGRRQIEKVLDEVKSLESNLDKGAALDFGCGIGRLTQALAQEFDVVYGVDISSQMIKLAIEFNQFGEKCKYIVNARKDLRFLADSSLDFVYTYIVLQHMPSEMVAGYLKEFIRVLRPRGILMFQIPVKNLVRDTRGTYLRSLPRFHPYRISNKVKGLIIGHGHVDRYYRLKRLGFSKSWLYKNFGFRPEIKMNSLDESLINELLLNRGARIVQTTTKLDKFTQMVNAEYVVVRID